MKKLDPESRLAEVAAFVAGALTGLTGLAVGLSLAPYPMFDRFTAAVWAWCIGVATVRWLLPEAQDLFMKVVDDD